MELAVLLSIAFQLASVTNFNIPKPVEIYQYPLEFVSKDEPYSDGTVSTLIIYIHSNKFDIAG